MVAFHPFYSWANFRQTILGWGAESDETAETGSEARNRIVIPAKAGIQKSFLAQKTQQPNAY
jgi:hypothetical protein